MYVYVLKSKKDDSFYVGITNNIEIRIQEHNRGYSQYTKTKIPWVLIRVEEYDVVSLAVRREKFLKTFRGRRVLKNLCV